MGRSIRRAVLLGGLLSVAREARGQTLTITGGTPPLIRINSAVAGQPPTAVTTATVNYRVSGKNNRTYHITGRLNTAMPPGMTLSATLTAPTGASSSGAVNLDATARTLVTNIINKSAETETITYRVAATVAAGVVAQQSRTVTFTLVQTP